MGGSAGGALITALDRSSHRKGARNSPTSCAALRRGRLRPPGGEYLTQVGRSAVVPGGEQITMRAARRPVGRRARAKFRLSAIIPHPPRIGRPWRGDGGPAWAPLGGRRGGGRRGGDARGRGRHRLLASALRAGYRRIRHRSIGRRGRHRRAHHLADQGQHLEQLGMHAPLPVSLSSWTLLELELARLAELARFALLLRRRVSARCACSRRRNRRNSSRCLLVPRSTKRNLKKTCRSECTTIRSKEAQQLEVTEGGELRRLLHGPSRASLRRPAQHAGHGTYRCRYCCCECG